MYLFPRDVKGALSKVSSAAAAREAGIGPLGMIVLISDSMSMSKSRNIFPCHIFLEFTGPTRGSLDLNSHGMCGV